MYRERAFSILELLIVMAVSIILMSAIYYTYTTFFMGLKSEKVSIEQEIEKVVGLELLRLDLEHLGYGVGKNSLGTDYKIYELDNTKDISSGKPYLLIRTTLNNSNNSTIGWRICKDINSDGNGEVIEQKMEESNTNFVYVDEDGNVRYIVTDGSCPSDTGVFIGYPFDSAATECNFNGRNFCTEIKYYLSDSKLPKNCHPNTYNLLRKVNSGTGQPLLSCVADVKFTVDMDTDGDGKIDLYDEDDISTYTEDKLREYTKRINVYILYQESTPPDTKYRFKNYKTESGQNYMEIDSIKLYLPSNFESYKWKVIKLSVKPMSIIR